jgi:hypothetical protein
MTDFTSSEQPKEKKSSVRHTRAIQRDRTKRPIAAPPDEEIIERLTDLVYPATLAQVGHYHQLGLRERTLTLPVMVAFVLSLIWRQISGVCELVRLVQTELLLWVSPIKVSQQALSQRLCTLPSELFSGTLETILPLLHARWQGRERPLPDEIAWAKGRYTQVAICDGSTLDALIRKIGLLRDALTTPLAGRMTALLDLCSRLPIKVWYDPDTEAHDQRFWTKIMGGLKAGSLLIFDLGYTNFPVFVQLTTASITFITRAKRNLAYRLDTVWHRGSHLHDQVVWIGQGDHRQRIRLIEILYRGQWYRYLTNELDPNRLPAAYVVGLYWQRWRIEDAYAIVKRLLGLAYFWCGSQNAIELQLWATWLLYGVLVDLTDDVAQALNQPFAALSMEMVYRSLYFYTQASFQGKEMGVVAYLAENAKLFGILKRQRKRHRNFQLLFFLTTAQSP